MKRRDRQALIADLVEKRDRVTSLELAGELGISVETVRRDLAELAGTGAIRKVHGGATRPLRLVEGTFQERMARNEKGKRIIARKLAALVEPGDTLFLDTCSTTYFCAEALAGMHGLTVVTNSVAVAQILASRVGVSEVYLLGGEFRADNRQTVGPMVIEQIDDFCADHAIVTVAAMDVEGGAMDADFDEARVARAMIAHSAQTVIVADGSKLGRRAVYRVCDLRDIDVFITDGELSAEFTHAFAQTGVACP